MGRMQTELHTGIDLAVELLRQDNLPTLLKVASRQLENTFGLTRCWSLELDLSGRTLHCAALGEQGEFDCGDFSHPFAHLLQQGKPRELSRAASYRLDHPGFQALVDAHARGVTVHTRACSGWVERVEAGDLTSVACDTMLRGDVQPLLDAHCDVLVLGCTHFPFLVPALREVVGPDVELLDTGPAVARQVERVLAAADARNDSTVRGGVTWRCSGSAETFRQQRWMLGFGDGQPGLQAR